MAILNVLERGFSDDVDPGQRDLLCGTLLTVDIQRAIVEHRAGEPCFRFWISQEECEQLDKMGHCIDTDWATVLNDGRVAIWRPESKRNTTIDGGKFIEERLLTDDVV